MHIENTIIIGAGPCGLSCALELQKQGIHPLIIEKGNIVNTIYNFPTHQVFFSSSEKLEIGDIPFITERQKPVRSQALAYYRSVTDRMQIRVNSFEKALSIVKSPNEFWIDTKRKNGESCTYKAKNIVIATGYYDNPNLLNVPGEELKKVMHYFKEAHPYYKQDIVIIGGKNSAVDAALELHKAGAQITVLYRGSEYSESIKPWILPTFKSLIQKEQIAIKFNSLVTKITNKEVYYSVEGKCNKIKNDFVFAMTGYRPDHAFFENVGILIDRNNGIPIYDERTFETNIPGIYIAGVVASGDDNNRIFIENGRLHGQIIAKSIKKKDM